MNFKPLFLILIHVILFVPAKSQFNSPFKANKKPLNSTHTSFGSKKNYRTFGNSHSLGTPSFSRSGSHFGSGSHLGSSRYVPHSSGKKYTSSRTIKKGSGKSALPYQRIKQPIKGGSAKKTTSNNYPGVSSKNKPKTSK